MSREFPEDNHYTSGFYPSEYDLPLNEKILNSSSLYRSDHDSFLRDLALTICLKNKYIEGFVTHNKQLSEFLSNFSIKKLNNMMYYFYDKYNTTQTKRKCLMPVDIYNEKSTLFELYINDVMFLSFHCKDKLNFKFIESIQQEFENLGYKFYSYKIDFKPFSEYIPSSRLTFMEFHPDYEILLENYNVDTKKIPNNGIRVFLILYSHKFYSYFPKEVVNEFIYDGNYDKEYFASYFTHTRPLYRDNNYIKNYNNARKLI